MLTQVKIIINIVIIIAVKSNSRVDLGQGSSHCLGSPLTQFNKKIKIVIIVILKPNLEVDSGQGPGHRSGGLTLLEPGQCKDKSCYYNSFKTRFKDQLEVSSGLESGGLMHR